jgi:hypothetical protein
MTIIIENLCFVEIKDMTRYKFIYVEGLKKQKMMDEKNIIRTLDNVSWFNELHVKPMYFRWVWCKVH